MNRAGNLWIVTLFLMICCNLVIRPGDSLASVYKPRVIVSTDPIELNADYRFVDEDIYPEDPETGDPDDMQSLVRFLLYANVFRIEGIIASSERIDDGNSKVWVNRDYSLRRVFDKYDEVDENLRLHDPDYPTADYLRSKIRKGYSCPAGQALPGPGKDTPGSDLIIQVVDASSEPLWYLDWVGQPQQFELSQALWRVQQERSPAQLAEFVSKLRVNSIVISKGGPGAWLRDNFPTLFLIGTHHIISDTLSTPRSYFGLSEYFMKDSDPSIWNQAWANEHVRQGHGALGSMFPSHTNHQKPGVNDYDSKTFLHLISNGLSDIQDPSMGNWGGRHYQIQGKNHWAPAEDNHPTASDRKQRVYYTIGRYQHAIQADFQARMDWCIRDYAHANHNPIAVLNGDTGKDVLRMTVPPGTTVQLSADGSQDPDNDSLSYGWWQYGEADSYEGSVPISNPKTKHASFVAPRVKKAETIHIILEVMDQGTPNLTSYRRLVVTVNPSVCEPMPFDRSNPVIIDNENGATQAPWDVHGNLKVSENRRHLVHADGTPFFWMGDTAWQLFVNLNRDEVDHYLRVRAQQRFNVIQAVALGEFTFRDKQRGMSPNFYGHEPLRDNDPTQPWIVKGGRGDLPNDYWDQVDYVIDKAAENGLYLGLLPCWGVNYVSGIGRPAAMRIFNTADKARAYGMWIGKRYKDRPNIIWIIGGDDDPNKKIDVRDIYRAMAEGIAWGVTGDQPKWNQAHPAWDKLLMAFHPRGGRRSAEWFHHDAWVDLHMSQSGHSKRDNPNSYVFIQEDLKLRPVKPSLNAEPCYEDHPSWADWRGRGPEKKKRKIRFRDADVRQAAYWSVFAGAAGHTYGHHAIWKFHEVGQPTAHEHDISWQEGLHRPGGAHMTHLVDLLEMYPVKGRVPDQSVIASGQADDAGCLLALRGRDHLYVYSGLGRSFALHMRKIPGKTVRASWFNPRDGSRQKQGSFDNTGTTHFDPPGEPGPGNDWVLILASTTNALIPYAQAIIK